MTAKLTAASADNSCRRRGGRAILATEGVLQGFAGVTLESESYVAAAAGRQRWPMGIRSGLLIWRGFGGELRRGDWLRTGSGSWVQVQSIRIRTASQRVHNLIVDDLHTYHVVAVETPVLVPNCGGAVQNHSPRCTCDPENHHSEVTIDRDSFEQRGTRR